MENEKNALNDISKAELKARGVSSLATRPNAPSRYGEGGLTAEQLKERFDALSGILAERINKIHAYLKASDLDENISITICGVPKTLAQFAEDLESGEAANYFTVKVGTNVSVSLQAAIDDILKDISDHGEASDEDFRSANARIDRSVATINIEPVVNGENITIVLKAMNDQGEVVTTDSINVPNADNLIASHNESAEAHQDIRGLIQSNGMQIDSLREDIADVRVVAEGRVRARAYRTWNDALLAISSFGTLEDARKEFAIGDQIYIRTPKSTDAWVSGFETRHDPYPGGHGDDLDPFEMLASTEIHVGYLILSPLEAPDVDLTGYVTTDDLNEYSEKVDSAVAETKEYVDKVVNSFDPPSADKVERLAAEVANLTARIAPEYFTTDSSVAYTKTVPADALPFAEVKEVGGMTHKCNNLVKSVSSSTSNLNGITVERSVGASSVIVNGTSTKDQSITLISLASFPTGEYTMSVIGLNSTDHLYIRCGSTLVTSGVKIDSPKTFTITESDTLSISASFFEGSSYSSKEVCLMLNKGKTALHYESHYDGFRNAAVTALETVGYNVLDLTPALNECLVYNGDGTYTLRKVGNSRFSGFIPLYIPKGQEVFCYLEMVDTSIDGFTRIPLQLFGADKKGNRSSIGLSNGGQAFAPQAATFFAKAYLQVNDAEGAYVTFRSPMIKYGKSAEFSPYTKRTYPIPAEVQALEGWGMGVNETYHNRLLWAEKKYRQEVARYVFTGDNLTNWEDSNRNFVGLYLDNVIPYLNVQGNDIRAVCNDFTVYARVPMEGERGIGLRQTSAMNRLYIRDDSFSSAADLKAYFAEKYASGNPVTIDYVLASPIVTDLPNLSDDNFIEVEGGGTVTAVNEGSLAAPTKIEYQLKEATA